MSSAAVAEGEATLGGASKLAAGSWALYDFANTIFSMNVVSLYFALWVTVDHGGEDIFYSTATSISMLLIAICSPVFGAASDQYGRRLPFLGIFTFVCIVFTAGIGLLSNLWLGLLFFVIANFAYQSGLVYYDSMLPQVSSEQTRGRISGIGVAFGYLGAIGGILAVRPFVAAGGRGAAFVPSALLFGLFALPCFLFVREKVAAGRSGELSSLFSRTVWHQAMRQTKETLLHARRFEGLLRFLFSRFLYTDAINTVILFMSVYAVRVAGFDDNEVQTLLIVSTTFAVIGSFVYGLVADRIGPKRTLNIVLGQWAVALVLASASQSKELFWLVGPIAGASMGATWVADRVFLLRLSPPQYVGEFFGIYGLAGKFSSITGPMLWGAIVLALQAHEVFKYRVAVISLLVMLVLGWVLLQGVSDRRRTWTEDERSPLPVGEG